MSKGTTSLKAGAKRASTFLDDIAVQSRRAKPDSIIGMPCTNSFVGETQVTLCDGRTVAIVTLEEGDEVLAKDPETGELVCAPVTATHVKTKDHLVRLVLQAEDGATEVVIATWHHPMLRPDGEEIAAGLLGPGDLLGGIEFDRVVVEVERIPLKAEVFNLTVAEVHTYFVGELSTWVHNCPIASNGEELVTVYRVHRIQSSNIVTAGAFANLRHRGKGLLNANKERLNLLRKVNSPDPHIARNALSQAQGGARSTPFIPTTFDRAMAIKDLRNAQARGEDVVLLTILGPKSGGVDFEAAFKALGGRTKRLKDSNMKEFGIIDLFIPEAGVSRSGFSIIKREK